MDCDTVDINPFLVWLAGAKVGSYSASALDDARRGLDRMRRAVLRSASEAWVPPLHQIEKSSSPSTRAALSRAHRALERFADGAEPPALDLLRIAFCQVLIRASRADFGHQSMSFQAPDAAASGGPADVADDLRATFERLALAASSVLPETRRRKDSFK